MSRCGVCKLGLRRSCVCPGSPATVARIRARRVARLRSLGFGFDQRPREEVRALGVRGARAAWPLHALVREVLGPRDPRPLWQRALEAHGRAWS